jgi:hypothetical protein
VADDVAEAVALAVAVALLDAVGLEAVALVEAVGLEAARVLKDSDALSVGGSPAPPDEVTARPTPITARAVTAVMTPLLNETVRMDFLH